MANRYGEAHGSRFFCRDELAKRWDGAMVTLYPTSPSARKKGCPRGAFLGLVKGIPTGQYTTSKDNKAYAVNAAALLTEGKQKWPVSELWRTITDARKKTHNSQMDIVLALWKNGFIVRKA